MTGERVAGRTGAWGLVKAIRRDSDDQHIDLVGSALARAEPVGE
jgi:hypothetical protein